MSVKVRKRWAVRKGNFVTLAGKASMKRHILLMIMTMTTEVWRHSKNTIFKKPSDNKKFEMVGNICDRFKRI